MRRFVLALAVVFAITAIAYFAPRRGEPGGGPPADVHVAGNEPPVAPIEPIATQDVERVEVEAEHEMVAVAALSPIEIRVVDADSGAPIAGARVSTWANPPVDAATGPDGVARLPRLPDPDRTGVRVSARAARFIHGHRWLAPNTVRAELALFAGVEISGRVIDAATGEPVSEANVSLFQEQFNATRDARQTGDGASTDPDGRFGPIVVRPGFEVSLSVEDDGHTSLNVRRTFDADAVVELVLDPPPPTGRVEVLVVDATGAPVENADVSLWPGVTRELWNRLDGWKTGAGGRWTFWDVSLPSVVHVRVGFDDAESRSEPLALDVEHAYASVRLVAPTATCEFVAHVVDAGGSPIRDARVAIRSCSDDPWREFDEDLVEATVTTDGGGTASWRSCRPGPRSVSVSYDGYLGTESRCELAPDTTTRLDITLRPSGVLEGELVDPRGQPVPRAAFWLVDAEQVGGGRRYWSPATDDDGRFRLFTYALTRMTVRACSPCAPSSMTQALGYAACATVRADVGHVRAVLPDPCVIRGRLARSVARPMVDVLNARHEWVDTGSLRATAEGDFELRVDVPPGGCSIVIASQTGRMWIDAERVVPGARIDLGEIEPVAGGEIEGVLLDLHGAPIVGVEVRHSARGISDETRATTDALGRFRFVDVPATPGSISLARPEWFIEPVELLGYAKKRFVELHAAPRPWVEFELDWDREHSRWPPAARRQQVDEHGAPFGIYVELPLDADGRARVRVDPGRYRLMARFAGDDAWRLGPFVDAPAEPASPLRAVWRLE